MSDSVRPQRWQLTRLFCPWDSPGKNTGVGCHFLLQCMRVKSESEVAKLYNLQEGKFRPFCGVLCRRVLPLEGSIIHQFLSFALKPCMPLLLPSRFSRVRLCATPQTAAHHAPPSTGFSRQEYWSGLPFPSPKTLHRLS